MPGITHWQHPKFFAYFPSIVTFESILGDMYSSSVTNPGFNVSERGRGERREGCRALEGSVEGRQSYRKDADSSGRARRRALSLSRW